METDESDLPSVCAPAASPTLVSPAASAATDDSDVKKCKFCDKVFSSTSNLRKHVKNVHGEAAVLDLKEGEAFIPSKRRSFSCDLCPKYFVILRDLRQHHVQEHNFQEDMENLVFDSNREFYSWKDGEESKTCCHFIASTGRKACAPGVFKRYLRCHRSGAYEELPIEQRQRQKKGQGSCKIGKHCFAALEVTEKESKVYVAFQKNHYGHSNEVCHQRLSQDEARVLAGRLAEGVPAKTIVRNIRAGTSGSSPRMQFLTTKDLRNIGDKFRIGKGEQRDPDDFKSVELWIQEMSMESGQRAENESNNVESEQTKTENESPLLYYRKKGDPNSHDGDFELAFMTLPQRELLSKLGAEKLCIDSTHGTNKYKFQLTTLLTISEDGSGIPCAYLISKRVNMSTMVRFFEAIKEKASTIQCQAFMSDDAPVYGNAWEQVMGPLKSRLLCSWHVLHNWSMRLNTVTNKDCRSTIRDMLHTLMKCTDEAEFQQLLSAFLNIHSKGRQLDHLAPKELEELNGFIRYFEKIYAKRACQWAYCYRQYIGLTTNNHLESMHKTLKYSYFGGTVNERLDKLIYVLFNFTADKLYNRAIALVKGRADRRKSSLFRKHKVGIELSKSGTERVGNGQWHVKSQNLVNFKHTVQRTSKSCSGCELHCKQCEACHNMYTCTCLDHVMHAHMCKHIHAVALTELQFCKLQSSQAGCSNCPSRDGGQEYATIDDAGSLMASAQHIMQSTQQGSTQKISAQRIEMLKVKAVSTFEMLIDQLPEKTDEERKIIDQDLTKFVAKHSLATTKQPIEKKLRPEPANKNVEKQPRYGALKHGKIKPALGHPPTMLQQETVKQQLLSLELDKEVMIIHTGNDHNYCKVIKS